LPGPMRFPLARSIRTEMRMPDMVFDSQGIGSESRVSGCRIVK